MNAPLTPPPAVPPYHHTPLFPLGPDKTPYRKLAVGGVTVEKVMGKDMLVVVPEALRALAEAAFTDINHLLRTAHLKQLREMRRAQQVRNVVECLEGELGQQFRCNS